MVMVLNCKPLDPCFQHELQRIPLAVCARSSSDEAPPVYRKFVLHTVGTGPGPIFASRRGREKIIASTDRPALPALRRGECVSRRYSPTSSETRATRWRKHLFRIRTFRKSSAEKMKLRQPPHFSAPVFALKTLLTRVHQGQNERENNCHIRIHRALEGVERKETHPSHSPLGSTRQSSPPVPVRVR
jgi:hypothetical protein